MEQNKQLTLGSLFDGSGGFPLAGKLAGIKPIWAADVEPFCIAVTRKNLPEMKHYGDVSSISGADLELVDIITWGSPCQGLSVAGKRKGLKDERSGLYVEAVRIVKEMLEATGGEYPKFCVFENVPGLLSSADGEDFITCLDMMQGLGFLPDANILDAQFMGVPQRRKRVFITWVQVDYILRKRTPLSDSIILQLLTEILQMNLAGLLRAYGIGLKKSAAQRFTDAGDGVKRRMKLFSLQKEDRLQMLQRRLEEIKATPSSGQSSSDLNHGNDQMVETMSTAKDMKSECLTTENQFWSIGLLLKSALEDGLQIESGSITSTWTKETISRKICTCFQALLNTLDVTMNLMLSLEKEPMSLNCFEWVQYILTETREFIDETKKYERSSGQVVWHDHIWYFEQELQTKGEQIERYFAEVCGCEVLSESESLPWNSKKGCGQGKGTAGDPPQSPGEAGGSGEGRVVLNDQGGSRMDVTDDVTCTLRGEAHHPPCVMDGAAGFCTEHSANARSIGYEEERSPTLRAGVVPAVVPLENHPADSRIKIAEDGMVQTLSNRMGTGGNNTPLVMEEAVPITMKIRCGGGNGGKGQLCQVDKSATLACNNDQTLFVPEDESCYWDGGQTAGTLTNRNAGGAQRMPDKDNFNCVLEAGEEGENDEPAQQAFGISSFKSHAMLSDNPHAGIYEAETSRTLDCNGGSPVQNQGGIAIVEQEKCYDIRQTSEGTEVSRCHCYETDTARSLGTSFPDPAGNHGGVAVVRQETVAFTQNQRDEVRDLGDKSGALQAQPGMKQQTYVLQGNMIGRDDKNGPQGSGINEDVCFTLNATDRPAVAAPDPVYAMTTGSFTQYGEEVSPTLLARDYKDPTTVAPLPMDDEKPDDPSYGIDRAAFNQGQNAKFGFSIEEELSPTLVSRGPNAVSKPEPNYTVRRLTPTECARLQGFYDWWTEGLANPNPTDEEVAFWTEVWETHRKVISHSSKPKTEKQIRKWLADPYSESAAYRLWGNGVALPCVYFIMCGIVWAAEKEQ